MKKVLLRTSLLIAPVLAGCGVTGLEETGEETRTITGTVYRLHGSQVTQLSGDRTAHRVLVLTDIHGFLGREARLIDRAAERFDCVVLLGDYISLWNLSQTHYEGIAGAIERAARTGKPVFVLNGNHDNELVYQRALLDLAATYSNIFDVTRRRKIDLKGVNFVGSPGGSDFTFLLNGFVADDVSGEEIARHSRDMEDGDPTIVLSHAYKAADCLFYGHTHVFAADGKDGKTVPAGQFVPVLRFNPGPVSPNVLGWGIGSAGLVEIEPDNGIRYECLFSN